MPKKKSSTAAIGLGYRLSSHERLCAERIKLLAKENNIPVIEDRPLARTLFQTLEVGMEIPPIFYQAVAEVLAKVFQMQRNNPYLKSTIAHG